MLEKFILELSFLLAKALKFKLQESVLNPRLARIMEIALIYNTRLFVKYLQTGKDP